MIKPEFPKNEEARNRQLLSYKILDTVPEDEYNALTYLASSLTNAPVALISLLDANRQWFKSCFGVNIKETDRSISFCAHAIHQSDIFVVENALEDDRFKDNPLVTGDQHVRFYAGVPLIDAAGFALGNICILDRQPNKITETQKSQLKLLAKQVLKLMELRKSAYQIQNDFHEISKLTKTSIEQQKKLKLALVGPRSDQENSGQADDLLNKIKASVGAMELDDESAWSFAETYYNTNLSVLDKLHEAYKSGDTETIRKQAHMLKSSSAYMGEETLVKYSKQVETMLRNGASFEELNIYNSFFKELKRVMTKMESLIEKKSAA